VAHNTIGLGAFLTILGLGTFALVNFDPILAGSLYPAALGSLFLALGVTAIRRPGWRRPVMYVAASLSLLALLLTAPGLLKAVRLLFGARIPHPTIALEHSVTALVCMGFLLHLVVRLRATPRDVEDHVEQM
jgi:hypothetical protein